jgi:hypothetical protein
VHGDSTAKDRMRTTDGMQATLSDHSTHNCTKSDTQYTHKHMLWMLLLLESMNVFMWMPGTLGATTKDAKHVEM